MKTTKLIIAAFAVAALASCTSQLEVPSAQDSNNCITEITATVDATKTSLQSDGKVFWEPGDAINLFYDKVGSKFTSTVTAAAASSKFTGSLTVLVGKQEAEETKGGLTGNNDYLWGVYPYNEANTSDGSSVTAVLPSTQIAKEGSFADGAYVTVGRSESPVMGFYGACGVIRFKVSRSDIKSVVFKGNKGEAVAGKLKVTFTDGLPAVTVPAAGASTIVTLEAPEGQTLKSDTCYCISLAPVSFTEGFEMIFTTSDNKVGSRKSATAHELKRSTVADLGVADTGVEFVKKTWSSATVIPYAAGTLAFEINPKTKLPELAIVQNVSGSKGPVLYFTDFKATPVTVTPSANTNNQYMALGIDDNGKSYVFTHNATSKKGEIYSSTDKSAWTSECTTIQQSNAYWGNTIGCIGSDVFMMTCNNAADATAGTAKRAVNVTSYNGTAWSFNGKLTNSVTGAQGYYYPMLRKGVDSLYCFVTNVSKGLTVTKYDGKSWHEVAVLTLASGDYAKYSYGINEHQDMVVAPDGQLWFAISHNSDPLSHIVFKYNPDEKTVAQVGKSILTTDSVSARSCRIGMNPKTEDVYLVYRDNARCLWVSKLNDQTYDDWDPAEQLTYAATSDVEVRFNEDGKGYIVCTTSNHVEVFTLL